MGRRKKRRGISEEEFLQESVNENKDENDYIDDSEFYDPSEREDLEF